MKRKAGMLALLAVIGGTMPAAGQVVRPGDIRYPPLPAWQIPAPERVTLPNGLVVFLLEDHELPLINVQVRIKTGSRYEPADKVGLADVAATVMRTGGAGDRSGSEVDQFLEDRAANLYTNMGVSVGTADLSVLKEHFAAALPILADVLRRPRFEEDKIVEAKVQEKSAIARRNDSPGSIAFREFQKLVYGAASPYARHTEHATIDGITRDDLVAFHSRFFHPNHVMIGVVGDFKRSDMLRLIRQHFGDWKRADVQLPTDFAIEPAAPGKVYFVQKTDITQTNFRLGHLGTTINDPDYFAVEVMNTIFGQGFSSRLFNVIRSEKGLAYAIYGGVGASYDYPGVFQVGGETKFESSSVALRSVLHEIQRIMTEPVSDQELSYGKESYLNSFVFNFDTPAEVVSRQMLYEYYGYPADFLQTSRARIEAVTAEDIRRAANRFLTPDRLVILAVGDETKLDTSLAEFGPVVYLDVTIPGGGS